VQRGIFVAVQKGDERKSNWWFWLRGVDGIDRALESIYLLCVDVGALMYY
jgi:hypothetical protein